MNRRRWIKTVAGAIAGTALGVKPAAAQVGRWMGFRFMSTELLPFNRGFERLENTVPAPAGKLTTAKLREARDMLVAAEVRDGDDQLVCYLSSAQLDDLLRG